MANVPTVVPSIADKFTALRERIAHNAVANIGDMRADLDNRMLAYIHHRGTELIDLVFTASAPIGE
jgi:hypothetical protein